MSISLIDLQSAVCRVFSNPVFIIQFEKSRIKRTFGTIRNGYKAASTEILNRNNIDKGLIYAVRDQNGRNIIKTSGNIPKEVTQQLRNAWGVL